MAASYRIPCRATPVFLTAFALHCYGASIQHAPQSARSEISLNGAWTVTIAGQPQQVSVPANIPFVFGLSTWTKTFTLALDSAPAVAYLTFDGIVNSATVTLNGATLGPSYAFTETRFDVSRVLTPNGDNTLVVTLDDRLTNDTVPGGATADYMSTFGDIAYTFPVAWANRPGIIRSVSLIYSSHPVITDVFARQSFDSTLSTLDLSISVAVAGQLPSQAAIEADLGFAGNAVGSCSALVAADGSLNCHILLSNPALWSPDSPNLHVLAVSLKKLLRRPSALPRGREVAGIVLDSGTDMLGFRKFEARGARFYLNGKPIFLRGVTRHDIYGTSGFVSNDELIQQDILRMKSLGLNFVRSIHYPPSESLSRYADQYGILLSEEIPAWAALSRPDVISEASQILQGLITRDYNRASLVIYNLGSYSTGPLPDDYLSSLVLIGKTFDPTRLFCLVRDDQSQTADQIRANTQYAKENSLDFYAQNTYWDSGIFAGVAPALPSDMPFLSTEWTGAEGSDRGPIGNGDTTSFPNNEEDNGGYYSETYEAGRMQTSFQAFQPYLCSEANNTQCIAGVVYFNWQDVEWPSMPYFYPNHLPWIRNGLLYEDRSDKQWPLGVFAQIISSLPN